MLKNKLEALLFSSGRKMDIEELSRLSNAKTDDIKSALVELKTEYDDKDSSVMIVNEGDSWKLTVREQFLALVQKIVTETELSKTITETLAVIAFKYPIKQSDLIKIRTNKAYDHLRELEAMGYITRQKHGRSNLIKLTQKFFEYFNLPAERLKEVFKDFASIAKAIENKETEIKQIKEEQKAKAEEEKQKDEELSKGIGLLDEEGNKLDLEKQEQQKKEEKPKTEIVEEKLGSLDVVNEPSERKLEKERERLQEIKEEDKQQSGEKPKFEGPGIKVTKEMEKIIDKKVKKIMHPPKEGQENQKENQEPENESKEEPKDLLEASQKEKEDKEKQ
jgi:segregation and condensation protein B